DDWFGTGRIRGLRGAGAAGAGGHGVSAVPGICVVALGYSGARTACVVVGWPARRAGPGPDVGAAAVAARAQRNRCRGVHRGGLLGGGAGTDDAAAAAAAGTVPPAKVSCQSVVVWSFLRASAPGRCVDRGTDPTPRGARASRTVRPLTDFARR